MSGTAIDRVCPALAAMLDASLLSGLSSLLLPSVTEDAAGREQLATKLQQIASELQADNAESQPAPDGPKGSSEPPPALINM